MNDKYKVLNSYCNFEGKFIKVYQDEVNMPDNKSCVFEVVDKADATAIVPIDNEGKVTLVRQYRHSILKETLEIPAGGIEKNETPEDCALRELEEETSLKANKLEFIFTIYPAIGFCKEKIHVYLATDLEQGQFNFDENEFISIEKYTLQEAIDLIFSGEIVDSKTIAALLATKEFIYKNK